MHFLLSIAALAAASTEESHTSSSSNLRTPSSSLFTQHPAEVAFLHSSMRSSSETKSSIHGSDDDLPSSSLFHHQPYESCPNSDPGPLSSEPFNSIIYSSALFMDAMQQEERLVEQSAHHVATCSPNESMHEMDNVMGSTPASLTPPLPQRGWVRSGRDTSDDDHDRRSFISSSHSDSSDRTISRSTANHEGARMLRTETSIASTAAERHHHQQQQGLRQQKSPTHRFSFMVSNSLLWMVTMVRNAVLA